MIKTTYKEKLPKGYSYPVGAEIISAGLSDVPQYEELGIDFWIKDEFRASRYNQKIKESGDIIILKARYFSYSWGSGWTIEINSVPSAFKKDASEKIVSQVLPALREKLLKTGMNGERFSFRANYSLATSDIKICC